MIWQSECFGQDNNIEPHEGERLLVCYYLELKRISSFYRGLLHIFVPAKAEVIIHSVSSTPEVMRYFLKFDSFVIM